MQNPMEALKDIDVNEDLSSEVKYRLLTQLFDGRFTLDDDGVIRDENGGEAEGYDTLYQIVHSVKTEARAEGYRNCQHDIAKTLGMR